MNRLWLAVACLFAGGVLAYLGHSLLQGQGPAVPAVPREPTSYRGIVKKILPAVVSIDARAKDGAAVPARRAGDMTLPDDLRGMFEEPRFDKARPEDDRVGFGSGFVVAARGVIVTNNHVVQGAEEAVVTFLDGTKLTTKKIHTDPKTDLAIVVVEPKAPLAHLEWGDSDTMEIGDRVLAVGAPFGLTGTVTHGIISSVGRSLRMNMYEDFLQTDAAINPGNSGGPLVNMEGKVIGITSAIKSRSGGFQGIGLAISANLGKEIVAALLKDGTVRRGYLGVGVRDVDAERARALGVREAKGVEVTAVYRSGPGEKAGLKRGDVLLKVGDKPIRDGKELQTVVARLEVGKPIVAEIIRDGKPLGLKVTVEEQPKAYGAKHGRLPDVDKDGIDVPKAGLALHDMTPGLASALKFNDDERGALIIRMTRTGAAAKAGLEPGLLITAVGGKAVRSAREAAAAINAGTLTAGIRIDYRAAAGPDRSVTLRAE